MASNVTRDHHLLTRNLKLNDKHISNDGEDEGISIADDGTVHIEKLKLGGTTGAKYEVLLSGYSSYLLAAIEGGVLQFNPGAQAGLINFIGDTSFENANESSYAAKIRATGSSLIGGRLSLTGTSQNGFVDQPNAVIDFNASGALSLYTAQGGFIRNLTHGFQNSNTTTPVTAGGILAIKPSAPNAHKYGAIGVTIAPADITGAWGDGTITISQTSTNQSGTGAEFKVVTVSGAITTVDDLTRPGSHTAWQASQAHTNVSQTSTDGSGTGLTCNISTDGSGHTTFVIVAPGTGYAIDEEITFTDPGSTSNTAVLVVATIGITKVTLIMNQAISPRIISNDISFDKDGSDGTAASGSITMTTATEGNWKTLGFRATNEDTLYYGESKVPGSLITVSGAANASNNGTFLIRTIESSAKRVAYIYDDQDHTAATIPDQPLTDENPGNVITIYGGGSGQNYIEGEQITLTDTSGGGATLIVRVMAGCGDYPSYTTFGTCDSDNFLASERMRIMPDGKMGIGTKAPQHFLSVQPTFYKVGWASQSGNTITGYGTTWTDEMIGKDFIFNNGFYAGRITARASNTSITVSTVTGDSFAAVDSNPDTITDTEERFLGAGFKDGMTITVSGSSEVANNGTHVVDSVTAGKLTLSSASSLTVDGAGDTWTISATATVNRQAYVMNEKGFNVGNDGTVVTNFLETSTSSAAQSGMNIDYDYTAVTGDGQTIDNTGLDLDINSNLTGAGGTLSIHANGTIVNTGIDLDIASGVSGAQHAVGLDIGITGGAVADSSNGANNVGILVTQTAGTHLKLAKDANDYATFSVADTGDLTIATAGDGVVDSDIIIDADGDIELNADGGDIVFKDNTTQLFAVDTNGDATLLRNMVIGGTLTQRGIVTMGNSGNTTASSIGVIANTHDIVGKALTISGGSTTAGTTNNIAGGTLTLQGGQGKGTGLGGAIIFQTANAGGSGSSLNALAEKMRIHTNGMVGIGVADPDTTLEVNGNGKVTHTGTTTHALEIDATALTTGSAVLLNVDDSLTASATKTLLVIDYDKSGVTGAGQLSKTTGLIISMADAATNHASGAVGMIGAEISIDSANAQGTIAQTGLNVIVAADSVGDAAATYGITTRVMDGGTDILMQSSADTGDYCSISTTTHGATTIATVDDADAEAAHLTFDIQGDTIFKGDIADGTATEVARIDASASSLFIASGKNIEFGDAGEYIVGNGTNLDIVSSGNLSIVTGGHVEFDGCAVGFDLVRPTYNATTTVVDFKTGNKQSVIFDSGNITYLALHFPNVSGNFVLLLKQDGSGSRTITNYKVYDSGGVAANGSSVAVFAGGSNPTLTTDANHVDIISIFWDSDDEIAYGVASLDFQF